MRLLNLLPCKTNVKSVLGRFGVNYLKSDCMTMVEVDCEVEVLHRGFVS